MTMVRGPEKLSIFEPLAGSSDERENAATASLSWKAPNLSWPDLPAGRGPGLRPIHRSRQPLSCAAQHRTRLRTTNGPSQLLWMFAPSLMAGLRRMRIRFAAQTRPLYSNSSRTAFSKARFDSGFRRIRLMPSSAARRSTIASAVAVIMMTGT